MAHISDEESRFLAANHQQKLSLRCEGLFRTASNIEILAAF
jgi:hypothetical protein